MLVKLRLEHPPVGVVRKELKMPSQVSPLANFLLNALMDDKYPDVLFWVDKTECVFCLQCICKNSKKWSQNEAKIFEVIKFTLGK
ncbi:hypothetical protein TNCV_4146291 [Trichonephila clavipes]|nr:hypothetical protein TNCV_4146291 [Trichonephila clavipes]